MIQRGLQMAAAPRSDQWTRPRALTDLGGSRRDNGVTLSAAVVAGTRPEIIKLAPLVAELGTDAFVTYTGQHYDEALAGSFFDAFGMPRPTAVVEVGGRSRGDQIGMATSALSRAWEVEPPDCVIVQGDTNSALAGAMAANACELPLVHLEAGLRSYDRAMPEEHNRVVVDHLSDLLLAPTCHALQNIRSEQITSEVAVVGNTIVEAVRSMMPTPQERARILRRLDVTSGAFILTTIHRPENADDRATLTTILSQLCRVSLPVLFSVHPRTRSRIDAFGLTPLLDGVRVLEPLAYRDFLGLSAESGLLISDSGGVQEEASVYKRPVIVVRNSTERPEVLGTFTQLVAPDELLAAAEAWLVDLPERHRQLAGLPSPYGDGDTSRRSAAAIHELLDAPGRAA